MTAVSAPFPAPRSAAATGGGLRRPLLVAVGDNVVDCYPQLGVLYPGGNAVNVAVNAARLGAPSAYIGVVGTDAAGRVVESALRSEGVDVSRLRIVEGTNAAATVHLEEGNRHFVGADTGVSRFRVNDGDLSLVGQAAIAHTGECSMLEEDLGALASSAQILSFDFSERDLDYVEAYAPHVQIATLSRPAIGTQEAVQMAMAVSELGPQTVVDGELEGRVGGADPVRLRRLEDRHIPADLDYEGVIGLRGEARERLTDPDDDSQEIVVVMRKLVDVGGWDQPGRW